MPNELVHRSEWDKKALNLAYEYAGFTDAKELSEPEKLEALSTLVPMALKVVDEARDTMESMHKKLDSFMLAEIRAIINSELIYDQLMNWWSVSIPELDNQTPKQWVDHDRVEDLLSYVQKTYPEETPVEEHDE